MVDGEVHGVTSMAGKPVCKFFREGRCKFGADCRFYHPTGKNDFNSTGWGNSRSGGYEHSNRFQLFSDNESGGGNYQNRERRNQWSSPREGQWSNQRGGQNQSSNQRGSQNQWSNQREGQNQWSNQRGGQNQWSNQRGSQNQWSNQRGSQNQWSNQRGSQNQWSNQRGGQNQWSNQRGQNQWSNQRGSQDRWNGGKQWNSRDNQRGTDQPTTPGEIAEMIRIDMEEWVVSKMWPLSCYAYTKETPCIEGFADISMDELRWEAYQAKALGNSTKYLQSLNELGERQMTVKKQFSSITADDVPSLQSGALFGGSKGSSLFGPASQSADMNGPSPLFSNTSKSSLFAPSPTGPTVSSMFGGQSILSSPQPPRSATIDPSFPSQTLTIVDVTRSATQPSITLPTQDPGATTDPSAPKEVNSLEGIINFTKIRGLTKDELDAYNLDKFVLGSLPEHAPPVM